MNSETKTTGGFEPKIVAFVCNWCTYLGADLAGTNRLEYPANVRIVRLPCTGRVDFNLLVKAFEVGADAVLVSGCHPGDCHYAAGNFHARRRWGLFRELLDTLGIDSRRVHFSWISAAEGAKFQKLVTEIVEKTGVSTATIGRVNRALNYGAGGYQLVLEKAKGNTDK